MDDDVHSGFVGLHIEELMQMRGEVDRVGPRGFAVVCRGLIRLLEMSS